MSRGGRAAHAFRINFSWLLALRWGQLVGQAAVILAVHAWMNIQLPLAPLGAIIALELGSNLACAAWLARGGVVRELHVALLVAFDILLFTAILYLTGGPTNPFSFLYLIHLALAALVLRPRWTWALVGLTLICSGALFVAHVPLAMPGHEHHHEPFGMHLRGMWIALGVAASFIVYFMQRVTRELAERESELGEARELRARSDRLASLATLAAGAAHELATPLSTIAVVSKELERQLEHSEQARALEDVRVIRAQIERCRDVLGELAADAGQASGEGVRQLALSELVESASRGLDGGERIRLRVPESGAGLDLSAPAGALTHALRSLLKNAIEASSADAPVDVSIERAEDEIRIVVEDSGKGMSPEVTEHAVEPFFTTKGAGEGMGLGLFLARSVAEQLGGRLELRSAPGSGTRATLVLSATATTSTLTRA
jgi:two-component system sensor histidine kinase RegB